MSFLKISIISRKSLLILGSVLGLFPSVLNAQEVPKLEFTLEECIAIAIENNVDYQQSGLSEESSKLDYSASKAQLLPTLNLNYNVGRNNGRSIDPFSNDIVNQKFTFTNSGLLIDATIFNGFRILNSIRESKLNMKAAEMEALETKQNLILDVTLLYIQILNNRDLLVLAKAQLQTTEEQLNRLKTLYDQGSGNPVDYTDIKGQFAIDEAGVVTAQNTFDTSISELLKLLNWETDSELRFQGILQMNGTDKYEFTAAEVYDQALSNLATFKAKELRVNAAEKSVQVARADYYPEISLFGQVNSTYSSAASTFVETGSEIVDTGDFVNVNGQQFSVQRNEILRQPNEISYEDQFNNNLNSVIGVTVKIPLINGFQAKYKVKQQKIERQKRVLELENTKIVFQQSIQQAFENMESAYKRYHFLIDQVAAFEESFRVNEVRFQNGVSNIVDYITSKNNMDNARINLSRTKYEYLLRVKVLEYYRGI